MRIGIKRKAELLSTMFFQNPVPNGGSAIKRSAFEKIGFYDETYRRAHDYHWYSKAAEILVFKYVQMPVLIWRWHDTNMSSGSVVVDQTFDVRILLEILERYGSMRIFPDLDWKNKQNESEAFACAQMAVRFISLRDNNKGLELLKKSNNIFPQARIQQLIEQVELKIKKKTDNFGKKVLFVVHNYPPNRFGGVENYTFDFVQEMIKRDADVSVIYPRKDVEVKKTFLEKIENSFQKSYNIVSSVPKLLVEQQEDPGHRKSF